MVKDVVFGKTVRKSYARINEILDMPNLIEVQKKSYKWFLEEGLRGHLTYKNQRCGIVLNNGGYYKNVITLVPSVVISDEEIDMALILLDQLFARFS